MNETHLRDTELARLSDGETGAEVTEHLRWCVRCRSTLADYRWLEGELAATLAMVANAVPVPRPRWWAVQGRLAASQRRQATGWRASFASVVLAVCFALLAPTFLSPVGATQTRQPRVVVVPTPARTLVFDEHLAPAATPTPAILREHAALPPTPIFELLPTPTEPGA
ncbi:MAG: hypothetical protein IMY86_14340, partial [Chloroflexi bacterium]|nr:hypothetical protein [Chloroflexota bacterium]